MRAAGPLTVEGHDGRQVPNWFIHRDPHSQHLAVFLPGMGYTCDMPLYYYTQLMLLSRGADLLQVEYLYARQEEFVGLLEDEQDAWLRDDVLAAYRTAIASADYKSITLVGKSVGTLGMGHLLTSESACSRNANVIRLTPILTDSRLVVQMKGHSGASLVVIGSADQYYDEAALHQLAGLPSVETLVVPDANHAKDIFGDISASVVALGQVVSKVHQFLDRVLPSS